MYLDRRILRLARRHGTGLIASVALGWLGGVVTVVQAWLLAHVVAQVFLEGADRAAVSATIGWLLAVIGARSALGWGADVLAIDAAGRIKHEIRRRVFGRLLDRGPVAAGRERTGELVTLLTEGVEALDAYISQYLPTLALAAAVPLTVAVVVLSRDLLSGVVLVVTAPLVPIFMVLIGRFARARSDRQWLDMARMSAFFMDTVQGLTTLKVLGRAKAQVEAVERVSEAFRSSSMAVLRIAFLSALVLELVATLSVAVVAVEVGLRLLAGRLDFGAAFFVLLLAPEFYLPLRRLGAAFHAGLAGVSASARLHELLGSEAAPAKRPGRSMPESPSLALVGVSFAYRGEGAARTALTDVSLEIAPGETVALVGPSGAGKSTVARMLLRFIEPDTGRLTADGVDAALIDPESWRTAISWVPQHPYLFADTVEANVRLGRPDASSGELDEVLRRVRAAGFVGSLPRGAGTRVGERGATLSGGQARRLALARAYLADAPVVILDEPAEDLDPRLRAEIDGAIAELPEGRSALVIAHRLPSVVASDRTVVMNGGRVVDQGSHHELLDRCGLYRELVGAAGRDR